MVVPLLAPFGGTRRRYPLSVWNPSSVPVVGSQCVASPFGDVASDAEKGGFKNYIFGPKTGSIGPKNPKKPENPGYNNYGIFWQFYGDFRFK